MAHQPPTHLSTRDLFRLDGRTILLSGGAGAVGLSVGKSILESGGDAVLLDMAQSPEKALWDEIQAVASANNTKVFYHQLNVTDASAYARVFETIREEIRYPIRGAVASAGISGESDAVDYDVDIFRKIVDVNLTGAFLISRETAKEIHKEQVTGSIVIIASMSGHVTNRGLNTSAYNASKSALLQLGRSLAADWGHPQNTFPGSTPSPTNPNPSFEPRPVYPPIRVNTLSPGHIETPISEGARKRGLTEKWAAQNMLGRISQVEEYRAAALFLLGDGSSFMTGSDLVIDGGHCAW